MCNQQNLAPHTAISTWSGFVYQGKIALYYCLKLISENYSANRILKLQLESQDDFAIYRMMDCLSIHQVKAYKSQNFSSYRDSFITQQSKVDVNTSNYAFFHVAREILDLPAGYETTYYPVKLFNYGNQGEPKYHCSLMELDTSIEHLITTLIRNEATLQNWKCSIVENIRKYLEAVINKKVIDTHHIIHSSSDGDRNIAQREFVEFSQLYEILEAVEFDNFETSEFFLSCLQSDIDCYYQQFCDLQDDLSDEQQVKLDQYIYNLLRLDVSQMEFFVKKIMPHRKGTFTTLRDYKDHSLDADSMKMGLLEIFKNLISIDFDVEFTPQSICWLHEGDFYYPTGIHTAQEGSKAVCYEIINNAISKDVKFLYENGLLITRGINELSIADVQFGPDAVDQSVNIYRDRDILNYTRMCLIALNDVPPELKDD